MNESESVASILAEPQIAADIKPWVVDADTATLLHDGGPWGIPLSDFRTYKRLGFWARHVAGKGWGDDRTIGALVRAYDELNWDQAGDHRRGHLLTPDPFSRGL